MTPQDLAAYLYEHIPLTRALAVEVLEVGEDNVRLRAPLAPNRNHRQTAFGGSVASLAILAGWGWLHARLAPAAPGLRLVIQRQAMEYLLPIDAAFVADCHAPPAASWQRFSKALASRGRGRIELQAQVSCSAGVAARFTGVYVAIAGDRAAAGELA